MPPPFHEPLRATLLRTVLIALVVGVVVGGARFTALSLGIPAQRVPPWALGGPIFVGVELVVHALTPVEAS